MDKCVEDVIKQHSLYLARRHKIEEVDRIAAIVKRIAMGMNGGRLNTPEDVEEALEYYGGPFLQDIFEHLPLEDAVKLLEDNHPNDIAYIVKLLIDFCDEPLYTYQELACLFKQFIRYLEDNRSSLLVTGYPIKIFGASYWLFDKLSPLYPVKIPYSIKAQESDSEGGHELLYIWRKEEEVLSGTRTHTQRSYQEAPFMEIFSDEEIVEIEETRIDMFRLKVDILEILRASLIAKTDVNLWDKCFEALASTLSMKQFQRFNRIEEKFDKLSLSDERHERSFAIIGNRAFHLTGNLLKTGGITNTLQIIEFTERELKIGKMHNTKAKLLEINDNKRISSYYHLLLRKKIPELIDITTEFNSYSKQEEENFKRIFSGRLKRDISRHFKVPLLVKPDYYDSARVYVHSLEQWRNKSVDVTHRYSGRRAQEKGISLIQLPLDTNWEDITIKFLDGHTVNIKAKGLNVCANYKEMGFEDSRRRLPNKQWKFLQLLAHRKGELSWDQPGANWNVKKKKQLLADTLKVYFQIEEDPFLPYKYQKTYKIRINLIPD